MSMFVYVLIINIVINSNGMLFYEIDPPNEFYLCMRTQMNLRPTSISPVVSNIGENSN